MPQVQKSLGVIDIGACGRSSLFSALLSSSSARVPVAHPATENEQSIARWKVWLANTQRTLPCSRTLVNRYRGSRPATNFSEVKSRRRRFVVHLRRRTTATRPERARSQVQQPANHLSTSSRERGREGRVLGRLSTCPSVASAAPSWRLPSFPGSATTAPAPAAPPYLCAPMRLRRRRGRGRHV